MYVKVYLQIALCNALFGQMFALFEVFDVLTSRNGPFFALFDTNLNIFHTKL